jgi:hypothetical protein
MLITTLIPLDSCPEVWHANGALETVFIVEVVEELAVPQEEFVL